MLDFRVVAGEFVVFVGFAAFVLEVGADPDVCRSHRAGGSDLGEECEKAFSFGE